MKYKIRAAWILYIFIGILWLISIRGISPTLKVEKNANKISIYFDNYLLGSAVENKNQARILYIKFHYQDLESKYFIGQSWSDNNGIPLAAETYTVSTEIHNPFAVRLYFNGVQNFVFFFNPYRHLNSGWEDPHHFLSETQNNQVQLSVLQGLLWCAWILLKPFPYVSLIMLPLLVYLTVFAKSASITTTVNPAFLALSQPLRTLNKAVAVVLPLVICAVSFVWSRHLMRDYLADVPHVPDAVSYVLSAKILASGVLVVPFKTVPSFIAPALYSEYFQHWFTLTDRFMFVFYPLGHPLVLSIGELLGHMEYIPPLVGSAVLLLIYLIVYQSTRSYMFGVLAMIICLASPFYQTQTIDYMSHNTASLFLLLSILPLFFPHSALLLLTGFFQGMLLNTRPLTFIITFFIIGTYVVIRRKKFTYITRDLLYGMLGFIFPLGLFFYFNFLTTGNIFISSYSSTGILSKVALGSNFRIEYGILHGFSNIVVFSLFFLKNYFVSFFPFILSFFLLPFVNKKSRAQLLLLQSLAVGIVVIWFLYDGNFFMYGPRFIYEVVPILVVLYGLVFYHIMQLIHSLYIPAHAPCKLIKSVAGAVILAVYAYQLVIFELAWLGIRPAEYEKIIFVPSNIQELRDFNSVNGSIKKYVDSHPEKNVFLMKKCENWWCTGEGIWLNTFPLSQSKRIILTLPDHYNNEIMNAAVVDWNNLSK